MQYRYSLLSVLAGTMVVVALPLNINMGAYSPALVVGDGAIGFKGTESVANIMNTLQGAATNSAAKQGDAAAAAVAPTAATPAAAAPATAGVAAAAIPMEGMGKIVQSRKEADLEGEADVAISVDDGDVVKRALEVLDVIAENVAVKAKRDLVGFNAALSYASGALKSGPEVQLGTGEGGSGVGITQKAGGATGTAVKANATAKREARDIVALDV